MNAEIPDFLSHLKVDERGYPIPFFVPIVDGKPNFKYADLNKFNICTEKHLCWVCGKKLIKDSFYFISGPIGLHNRIHSDPAMHKECAQFTLMVCPHLYFYKAERKATDTAPPYQLSGKPECLFLVKSSKYKLVSDGIGVRQLVKFNVIATEKYIYVDNKLQKQ
ncbi:MAG TPA: hypothetical protein VGZ90_13660 [Puia sp.]|jgi:hypothetical protein|nr:hypothetical protein [Puia sp.]